MTSSLRHPEAEQRRQAVAALGADEAAHALPELWALLDDADWRVRREVALALARLRDPRPAIDPLVEVVETGDVTRRNAAIEALRHIGPPAAPAVLARLEQSHGHKRRFLIEVLAEAGTPACVPALRGLLDDPDANIPPAAAEALGRIGNAAASAALLHALGHGDPVVRLAALQAFAAREEALPWSTLGPLVRDPLCRRAALRAAALCTEPAALDAIVSAVSDVNATLASEASVACAVAARRGRRASVERALQSRPRAARILRHLADHGPSAEVRRASVECLGMIADPSSVVSVLRAAEVPETSAAAEEALARFDSQAVAPALEIADALGSHGTASLLRWALERALPALHPALVELAWRALDKGDESVAAWDVIGAIGSEQDGRRLIERLVSRAPTLEPSEYSRALVTLLARHPELASRLSEAAPLSSRLGLTIAEIVAAAGHPVPIEPLREALTSEAPSVRAAAVRALAATGHPSARDALELALGDEDPGVQAAAAEGLGALGAGQEVLEESLRAAEPRVRQAAARALALRGGDLRRALVPALDDPEPGVVLAALEGLADAVTTEDLTGLSTHGDPDVAAEALVRLRRHDRTVASHVARKMLDHPVWSVRLEAVRALDTSNAEAVSALAAALAVERDALVREAIERVLSARPGGNGA